MTEIEAATEIPVCPHCAKPLALCVCEAVGAVENRVAVLILQHPQEQDRLLGTARLAAIAPVTAIRGNVDTQPWARTFAPWEVVTLAGRTIYVVHDRGALDLDPVAAGFDMVMSGHSHQPRIETVDGVVYLNPGSAGPRRFRLPITLATVELTAAATRPEIHELVV